MLDRVNLGLEVVAEDVGATQAVTISLGGQVIGRYWAHTRYPDRAIENARNALAGLLKPLIDQAMADDGCEPYTEELCSCSGYGPHGHEYGCPAALQS